MSEMAELYLASSDPYDEFERSGEGYGSYGYRSSYHKSIGRLEEKQDGYAKIDGKWFDITEKASNFINYIRVGNNVSYTTKNEMIVFIKSQ